MDQPERVNLQEAAGHLGVHYQTVYRWVRLGTLPAVKIGGTYVVEMTAIAALEDARRQPAPPPARREVRDWQVFSDRLHAHLRTGDEVAARELLEDLGTSGISVTAICDHVLVPALIRVGEDWAAGDISIAEEHRASAICQRALGRLAGSHPGRPRGVCVVCTAPGDQHDLPAQMATLALREDHWRVHHLGTGVPIPEIVALSHAEDADLVVISVTWAPALAEGQRLAGLLEGAGRRTLVGRPGQALADLVVLARGAAT